MMKFLLLLAASAAALVAQTSTNTWEVGAQVLPTSAANICSDANPAAPHCNRSLHLGQMTLVNTTSGAITVTLTDNSTNCGGSVCTLFSAAIAANTTYTVALGGARANGGALWSATATGVHAWLAGN